ncbi:MAG: tRNA (adenosine(37)-N6)-threonylcarbamoyltransferase complex ATPase subunit type 1 TsaE [Chloroflexi bacterium]|nr:tRNA (adenosine(37)-N6)-threonylcarbamoyltransferase complex ATPase subunit type 1 TsaE [Chloroflexota bacterium]
MNFVSHSWTTITHSADETRALGARVAQHAQAGDVVWLCGDLGAGKTTFTQGLGQGLGVRVPIISPTFVLIREYHGRLPLYHADLYRTEGTREILNLGLRDYLDGDGVCVVEWAERFDAEDALGGLHIRIEPRGDESRAFTFDAVGERARVLLDALRDGGRKTKDES